MSDRLSVEKRSWNMSRIRGKDTKIEVAVRQRLLPKVTGLERMIKGFSENLMWFCPSIRQLYL